VVHSGEETKYYSIFKGSKKHTMSKISIANMFVTFQIYRVSTVHKTVIK